MTASFPTAVIGLSALTLLLFGSWQDLRWRTIPNAIPAGLVVLFGMYGVTFLLPWHIWPGHIMAAAALFAPGFLLWARGFVGGGDVKFLSALALWAGLENVAGLLLITALTGGALALLMVLRAHWLMSLAAAIPGLTTIVAAVAPSQATPAPEDTGIESGLAQASPSVPYGVAIAAGGVWVLYRTFMV